MTDLQSDAALLKYLLFHYSRLENARKNKMSAEVFD